MGPAPFRTHRAPFPIPRVFAFQAPEWLLVHLDWVLSSRQACPLSLAGKEALKGRRDGRAGEEGETEATVFLDDLQVCRGVRGTSGLLATVPFPCVPLRDMQLFKAVAVGRMETDPEAPQNPERWSPPFSPTSAMAGSNASTAPLVSLDNNQISLLLPIFHQ